MQQTINSGLAKEGALGDPVPPTLSALRARRDEIMGIAAAHGAYNVRMFGSVSRGDADCASDVDLLVEMEPGRSLLDLGGMLMALEGLLGWRVDIVTERGLRSRIRQRILPEIVPL